MGEGDGFVSQNSNIYVGGGGGGEGKNGGDSRHLHSAKSAVIRDSDSRFFDLESRLIEEDSLRPAVKLALALHRVSKLELGLGLGLGLERIVNRIKCNYNSV